MPFCIFDSPTTCCRETWSDGKLIASVCMTLIAQPDVVKRRWSAGLREVTAVPFAPGRIEGDPAAMQLPSSTESHHIWINSMTELSPAAKAVYVAFEDATTPEAALAAALRAAADQDETLFDINDELVPAVRAVRTDQLLAIANELEAQ